MKLHVISTHFLFSQPRPNKRNPARCHFTLSHLPHIPTPGFRRFQHPVFLPTPIIVALTTSLATPWRPAHSPDWSCISSPELIQVNLFLFPVTPPLSWLPEFFLVNFTNFWLREFAKSTNSRIRVPEFTKPWFPRVLSSTYPLCFWILSAVHLANFVTAPCSLQIQLAGAV